MRVQGLLTAGLPATLFFSLCTFVSSTNVQLNGSIKSMGVTNRFSNIFPDIHIRSTEEEDDPSKFWDNASQFGDEIIAYTNLLISSITHEFSFISKDINSLKSTINSTVTSPGLQALRTQLQSRSLELRYSLSNLSKSPFDFRILDADLQLNNSSNPFSIDLSNELQSIMDQFQEDFPPPSTAPNHAERVKLIGTLMDRIEDGLVDVMGRYGVSEEDTRNNFAGIKSGIETALVLLGDIVEQHPCILEAILFSATILFVPEAWIFRPVLSCFGFGPLGPVKGSTAAWAQSRFFGATIDSGSWFSRLQQVAMGGWTLSNLPKIVLGVGAALCACCCGGGSCRDRK